MSLITIKQDQNWERLRSRGYCRQPAVGIGEPTPPVEIPRRTILLGDATEQLRTLPAASIDCVISSPPYYQLRDYAAEGQLGLEATVDGWVKDLRSVFAELSRVMKPAASLWLNLGDSFSRHARYGAPPKSLLCAPERMLLALAADGWIVRGKVVWSKPNPLPNSVADRPNLTYEVVYFLVRSPRYFFDLNSIRQPHRSRSAHRGTTPVGKAPAWAGPLAGSQDGLRLARAADQPGHPLGKNPGSVWEIATQGFRGPHFATFPPALIRRPILATCPEAICTRCGTPWQRQVNVRRIPVGPPSNGPKPRDPQVMRFKDRWHTVREVGELIPCACDVPTVPGVVLDPFMGAGTVGVVAESLQRDWLGIEISPEFRDLAIRRIEQARGLP
jgi:site-specific DNA-methyltransferase (adenine-specific)